MRLALPFVLICALFAAGCGTYASHVEADDTSLGRVVVYRNGIAYYERKATVEGDSLTLTVPNDKVDDFLKSLTVRDARTGEPLPVAYPTTAGATGSEVGMTIQLPPSEGGGPREVVVTYITEAPAWKPTYRLVMDGDDSVSVQGWAIVDNTSGEDWEGVKVGVGSSSALSFRYDLRTVRTVLRETLRTETQFAQAPPTGGGIHRQKEEKVLVLAELADAQIPRPAGHPEAGFDQLQSVEEEVVISSSGGGNKRAHGASLRHRPRADVSTIGGMPVEAWRAQQQLGNQRVQQLAAQLNSQAGRFVIEGYAATGESDTKARSLDRANTLRNQLIVEGVAPARLEVAARGLVPGQGPGVKLVEQVEDREADATGRAAPPEPRDDSPVGESHFESESPMTVTRGTSAMVSVFAEDARGEIVYLYDADGERGDERYAFRAVRFDNPTESTLESGPVTVYGDGRFIGEGLTDPIPPKSTALIPFALDRQVVVEREGAHQDRIARLMTLQRGVLTTEVQHTRRTTMRITNRQYKPAAVFVRHRIDSGWKLTTSPEVYDRVDTTYLFQVEVAAGETRDLVIEEATPMTRTVDLRSDAGIALVKAYLDTPEAAAPFQKAMRELLAIHAEMANHQLAIRNLRQRMAEYRDRSDELQSQITSLSGLRGGSSLLRLLQAKLKDMANRIQKSTIAVVDRQEKLMLARIRFQDGVSELTLQKEQRSADNATVSEG